MNFQITGRTKAFFTFLFLRLTFIPNFSNPTFLGGDGRGLDQKFCSTVREITFEKGQIPFLFSHIPRMGISGAKL